MLLIARSLPSLIVASAPRPVNTPRGWVRYWYGANLEDPNDRGYDAVRRLFLIETVKAEQPEFGRIVLKEKQ
jgi:hypothetical protein